MLTDFSGTGSDEQAFAVAIQGDGKIVAAGYSLVNPFPDVDFALARYNTDGSLDGTFGAGGKVLTDFSGFGSYDWAYGLAIQSDGKIVATGITSAAGGSDFGLARYNTDGSLDGTFGTGGTVVTNLNGTGDIFDIALALAIQSDGKLVAAGMSDANGGDDFGLVRYNTNGSLDGTFGAGGVVLTDFGGTGSSDWAWAVRIGVDGKIVAAGNSQGDQPGDFAVARYNDDGSLDATFGTGGTVLTDFSGSGSYDGGSALALQTDGRAMVGGLSNAGGTDDFALARYNTDGSLDETFGSAGKVLTDFSRSHNAGYEHVVGLAIQGDGKIVAVGVSDAGGSGAFALARYLP